MLRAAASPVLPALARHLSAAAAIDVSALRVQATATPKPKLPNDQLAFGSSFTDHQLEVDWTREGGWEAPVIKPYGPLQLDPASSCLHYALQCFEGMKAYRGAGGEVRLFRPDKNMARMQASMERLALPFDAEGVLECIKELVRLERDWVPTGEGYSLYIRPTGIGTHPYLGVGPSSMAKVFCILSPAGPYYPTGFKPVSLLADPAFVRAWPGGTGNAKVGGNYAPGIKPAMDAVQKGYSQILWLFGEDHSITEVGTMNLFIAMKKPDGTHELCTAPLDRADILPGVTRLSALELARGWGDLEVSERFVTMEELITALNEGRVTEIFGCGTAAVVSSVDRIGYNGVDYAVPLDADNPEAGAGKIAQRLWNELADIQYGRVEHEWSVVI